MNTKPAQPLPLNLVLGALKFLPLTLVPGMGFIPLAFLN